MTATTPHARLAFIGGGNMARALLSGLLRQGWPADCIVVSEPGAQARAALGADFAIRVEADNAIAAAGADVLVLAVKPQVMQAVCAQLAPVLAERAPLVISIAAGIAVASLRAGLGTAPRIARCMPNTPALIGQGITGLYADHTVEAAERQLVESLLGAVGSTVWIEDESLMDAVTAVSGSGPAYFFALMEGLIAGAQVQGLSAQTARQLVLKTALGAASLALDSAEPPEVLRQRVTSPGGTTAAGLQVFSETGLHAAAIAAVAAATRRGTELSKSFG
jgi:pyrroline-5-carboxylate reductase